MSRPRYLRCEGSGHHAVDVDPERSVASCPVCAFTFSTLMDDPVVAPHYVGDERPAITAVFLADPG